MNRLPILAEEEELDIFVVQDAASMFIFGNAVAPHGAECPSDADVTALLEQAWSHQRAWPAELVLPGKLSARNAFARIARERSIEVKAVAESQMSFYIIDVQSSFEEYAARDHGDGPAT